MRKLILCVAMAVLTAIGTWASPALPVAMQVRQADGTLLTVEQFGDEYHHWTATSDGVIIVNTGKGYYVAQIDDDGVLSATNILAHNPIQRSAEETAAAIQQTAKLTLFHERGVREVRNAPSISTTGGYVPHAGNVRVLIILAAYQDLDFIVNEPSKAFDQYLNGETQEDLGNTNNMNYSSVSKYFEASSHGQFNLQFDVVGPVTLPQTMAYYGGGPSSNEKMGQLGKDACNLVKDQVDFKNYDNDNDGNAELVFIIHAGYGQNQGGPEDAMWAKMSTLNIQVTDDIKVTRIGCCAELFHPTYPTYINGIGVFCHEFSHALGLPDLYPTNTNGRSVNNQTMEYWDVMDGGLYSRNGFAPTPYTAWEQEVMGWIEIEPLTASQDGVTLLPVLEEGGKAYKIQNAANANEYIAIENIQKRGFNTYARNHGLLVYHVAYPNNTVHMGDSPNNTAGKPAVAVVPADGIVISNYQREGQGYGGSYTTEEYRASMAGDPFPGTSQVTALTDDMQLPNYHFYNGEETTIGYGLVNITEDTQVDPETNAVSGTGVISFDYKSNEEITAVRSIEKDSQDSHGYYTIDGRYAGDNFQQLPNGLYIGSGKKQMKAK